MCLYASVRWTFLAVQHIQQVLSLVLEAVGAAAQADAEEDDQHQDEHHNDDDEPHLLVLPPHLPPQRHPSSAHVALVYCTTSCHLLPSRASPSGALRQDVQQAFMLEQELESDSGSW